MPAGNRSAIYLECRWEITKTFCPELFFRADFVSRVSGFVARSPGDLGFRFESTLMPTIVRSRFATDFIFIIASLSLLSSPEMTCFVKNVRASVSYNYTYILNKELDAEHAHTACLTIVKLKKNGR